MEADLQEKFWMRQQRCLGYESTATYAQAKSRRKWELLRSKSVGHISHEQPERCGLLSQQQQKATSDLNINARKEPTERSGNTSDAQTTGPMKTSLALPGPLVITEPLPSLGPSELLQSVENRPPRSPDMPEQKLAIRTTGVFSSEKPKDPPDHPSFPLPNELPASDTINPSATRVHETLRDSWERIRRLREVIWGLRSRLQRQRSVLREKQDAKVAADNNYMKLLRLKESLLSSDSLNLRSDGRTLEDLFQDCERARAEYGPIEYEYNMLEDQLGGQEFELTRLERKFVDRLDGPDSPRLDDSKVFQTPFDNDSILSDSDAPQEFHPQVAEYLSKMGDVDLLREKLDGHRDERDLMQSDKETRENVNLSLSPEDQAWLDKSDDLEKQIIKELEAAEAEAEILKQKCLSEGLLDENDEPIDFQTEFESHVREAFQEEEEVDPKDQTSEYIKFPILLPHLGTRSFSFHSSAPTSGQKSDSAGDHINQWLLHDLRSSPMSVNLLARTFEDEAGQMENERWQLEVLDHWYRDGAIKDATGYQIYSTGTATEVAQDSKLPYTEEYEFVEKTMIPRPVSRSGSDSESDLDEVKAGSAVHVNPLPPYQSLQSSNSRGAEHETTLKFEGNALYSSLSVL